MEKDSFEQKLFAVLKQNPDFLSTEGEVLKKLAEDEHIPVDKIEGLIGDYLYTQKLPREQDIADLLPEQPRILERKGIVTRIKGAIEGIVDRFEW